MKNLACFAAITACCLVAATPAAAALQLDQFSVPETGVMATQMAGGGGVSTSYRYGQSFTVGLDGTLGAIDLGLFSFLGGDVPGLTFELYGAGPAPLFSSTVSGADIPAMFLGVTDWSSALHLDLSSANLQVHAGDQLRFMVGATPEPASDSAAFLTEVDYHPFSYAGGSALYEQGGVIYPQVEDFGFRTYVDTASGAVPEPAEWALLLMGFALAGGALRQRRLRRMNGAGRT